MQKKCNKIPRYGYKSVRPEIVSTFKLMWWFLFSAISCFSKLFPSLNDNPNSRCETSEKLENKQFAGFEKIIFMWKPLGEMSKLTPSFSFSASIFMSDARIFGSKFVLLQILKYHQMIQYYNGIHPNLSTFNITKYY